MGNKWLRIVPLGILLLLSLALAWILKQPQNGATPVAYAIDAFDIPVLGNGSEHFTPASWRGKVVVLNAFATWCLPCQAEHAALMRLAEHKNILFYGLAWRDKPKNVEQWFHDHGNPFRVVGVDEHGASTIALALSGVPETFIIDKNGIVRYHLRSVVTDEIINDTILPLVEKLDAQ